MQNEKISEFSALVRAAVEKKSLKSIVLHASEDREKLKAKGKLKSISGSTLLQMETYLTEGRVSQANIGEDGIASALEGAFDTYKKADLSYEGGSAAIMISKKGKITLIKKGSAPIATESGAHIGGNDREKNRLLKGDEKFLIELGISAENGRVHDKKQSKFRQISRFSEYIVEAEKKLPRGPIYVCDLCCGKSYLSFAAYHVLSAVCGREVKMICVDLKQSVMDYCADIAKRCGMTGMEFECMNIFDFVPERRPDLVISLHACDIATDMVLNFASKYRADMILSTPCCHHRMSAEIDSPLLSFITERPILSQKLCTAATDALRLLKLEAEGYKTDATELIDPEDTPKNVMLRAERRKNYDFSSQDATQKKKRYDDTFALLYGRSPAGEDCVIIPEK